MDRLTDQDGWRWYSEIGGSGCLSVTTIIDAGAPIPLKLKQYFIRNTEKKQADVLKAAGEAGTEFHGLVEATIKNESIEVPEKFKEHHRAFEEWRSKCALNALYLEKTLVSKKYGFAGTCDFIGTMNGEPVIVDWKTSNVYKKEPFAMQLGAYRIAAIEMGLVPTNCGMGILQVKRDTGELKYFAYKQFESCEDAFLRALDQLKFYYWSKLDALKWKYLNERALVRL